MKFFNIMITSILSLMMMSATPHNKYAKVKKMELLCRTKEQYILVLVEMVKTAKSHQESDKLKDELIKELAELNRDRKFIINEIAFGGKDY